LMITVALFQNARARLMGTRRSVRMAMHGPMKRMDVTQQSRGVQSKNSRVVGCDNSGPSLWNPLMLLPDTESQTMLVAVASSWQEYISEKEWLALHC
jgi:hypothetical protein